MKNEVENKNKFDNVIKGISGLSLGFSIVIAILLGVGFGILLKNLFGIKWLFWLGVGFGICAAILNVYKAYKAELKEFEKIADDIKYKHKK